MRARFQTGIGGTLRYRPREALELGAPSIATITIKTARGLDLPTPVVDAPATIVQVGDYTELQYVLSGDQCPDPLSIGQLYVPVTGIPATQIPGQGTVIPLYRAAWKYTINGAPFAGDQLYEVRKRLLFSTLMPDELERALPAKWEDLSDEGDAGLLRAIDDAWGDVLDDLQAKGYEPDKVMDPDRLRQPHKEKALANISRTWGQEWKDWATAQAGIYRQALDDALSSGGWYDTCEDSVQGVAEVKWPAITLQR